MGPVPRRAVEKPSTYIWASEALDFLTPAYGSIETAERVLLREAKAGRIPWSHMDVDPPGTPINHLWRQGTLNAQLARNAATFKVPIVIGDFHLGYNTTVKVGGIKFERAAVEALLPADYVARMCDPAESAQAPPAESPPPVQPIALPKAQRIVWAVLRHEWPPDGTAACNFTTSDIEPRVRAGWKAACKRLGLRPYDPAQHLRSTINRALGRLRDRK
jgi:hypothetical protein